MHTLKVYCYKQRGKSTLKKFHVKHVSEVPILLAKIIRDGYKLENWFFDGVMWNMEKAFDKWRKDQFSFSKSELVQSAEIVQKGTHSVKTRAIHTISVRLELDKYLKKS